MVIPANASSVTIPVTVIDDNVFEGNETVIITLSNNASYTVGSPNSATVTIADDETAPLGPSIVAAPSSVLQGGSVTGTWSGIVNASASDWIGLYAVGAGNGSYFAWLYVSCTNGAIAARASGSCSLTIPSGVVNGSYELRMWSNAGFNTIATSNAIAVGGPPLPVVSIAATANAAEP
jgi:hypothetical protein